MSKSKSRSRMKRAGTVVYGRGENGERVKVVLYPPPGKGKIDPKLIRAAVKQVREERIKAQVGGE